MKFFEGCTALITGASSGLGAEFARQLAPLASRLVLVARRKDRLEELASTLRSIHPQLDIRVFEADLTRSDRRHALADWLANEKLDINFLINNAGLGDHGHFESSDWTRVQEMIDLSGQSKAPTMDWDGEVLADFGVDELVPFLRARGVAV
jgi:short-subunit dehydrogenase